MLLGGFCRVEQSLEEIRVPGFRSSRAHHSRVYSTFRVCRDSPRSTKTTARPAKPPTPTSEQCPDSDTAQFLSRLQTDVEAWSETGTKIGGLLTDPKRLDPKWQKTIRNDLEFWRYMSQQIIDIETPDNRDARKIRLAFVATAHHIQNAVPFFIMGIRGLDQENMDKAATLVEAANK